MGEIWNLISIMSARNAINQVNIIEIRVRMFGLSNDWLVTQRMQGAGLQSQWVGSCGQDFH